MLRYVPPAKRTWNLPAQCLEMPYGEGLPDGTYYYIFTYRDEKGKQHKLYGPLWITRLY